MSIISYHVSGLPFTEQGHAPPPALLASHDNTVVFRQLFARRWRIMKLSKEYSATCHHKYWSARNAM